MDNLQTALELAKEARLRAYRPYSNFAVGCVVKAKGHDRLFTGCNIENASFPATICAERAAICHMNSLLGKQVLEYVLLVTDTSPASWPCGVCRQVISEFCDQHTRIYVANLQGIQKEVGLKELLPHAFTEFSS